MEQINLFNAKAHLSTLVRHATTGEELIIAKNGTPQTRLVPVQKATHDKLREPGRLKRVIQETHDFDQTPEEVILSFEKFSL